MTRPLASALLSRNRAALLAAALALILAGMGCTKAAAPGTGPGGDAAAGAPPSEITVDKDGSAMVLVPAGRFRMGDRAGSSTVRLKAFYIDRLEVANEQYAKFLKEAEAKEDAAWRHPDQPKSKKSHRPATWGKDDQFRALNGPKHPVVGVDWFDAYAYAQWAGKRLPTEAEWERAARGTDGRVYPWGNAPPEEALRFRANYFSSFLSADGYRFTAPVGSFPEGASAAGCLNMGGNAAEWCADRFVPAAERGRAKDLTAGPAEADRVVKGGAWNMSAASLRAFSRLRMKPTDRLTSVGFRCVRDVAP